MSVRPSHCATAKCRHHAPRDANSGCSATARRLSRFILICILIAASGIPACAQQLPVRLRLEPLSIRGRSGGPIPMRIKLEYNLPQVLEGDLLLKIYNSLQTADDLMATIRYEGIVLHGQDYFFSTVLPPIEHSVTKQYLVVGWFETEHNRIPLTSDPDRLDPPEPHEVLTIGNFERATLICSCSGEREYLKPSVERKYLDRALSLDNYNPGNSIDEDGKLQRQPIPSERVQNFAAPWDALDMPEDPLHLCSFDLVTLVDGALSRLDDGQMQALLTWVKAGGSLCVLPNNEQLTRSHLQFLQTIFESTDAEATYLSLTDRNELLVISDVSDPIVNRTYGLGRATLLPSADNLRERLQGKTLGQVVAHLWKLRHDSPVRQGKTWGGADLERLLNQQGFDLERVQNGYRVRPRDADDQPGYGMGGYGYAGNLEPPVFGSLQDIAIAHELDLRLPPQASPLPAACESALLPTGVKVVPTSVIALLLIAYVVTIGPVDYFLLGFFRLRKFTWVLFPVVTAVFTALTVGIAHRYMETTDTGSSLTITDLVDDGQPVRETKIQMQFRAAQMSLTQERTSVFTVPAQMNAATRDPYNVQTTSRPIQPQLHYAGRFPQKYVTTQNLSQWKPQLTRLMTLAPKVDSIPSLPWHNKKLITTKSGREELRQHFVRLKNEGHTIDAIIVHKGQHTSLFPGNGFLFSNNTLASADNWLRRSNASVYQQQMSQQQRIPPDMLISAAVMQTATPRGKRDFFSLVSHVSPQGSASMEDLAILDPTDPDQWLLIVAVREGEDTKIYRRLYCDRESVSVSELPPAGGRKETCNDPAGCLYP